MQLPHGLSLLPINLVMSTIAFALIARLYILPKLNVVEPRSILLPIALFQSFRHFGLMFIEPGAVFPGLPHLFAYPAAGFDMIASLLAFAAVPLLLRDHPAARPVLWALTIEGSMDLFTVITLASVSHAPQFMGPTFWIRHFLSRQCS